MIIFSQSIISQLLRFSMTELTLIETKKSKLYVIPDFTEDHFQEILDTISPSLLHEPEITVYGKVANQRRNIAFFSNESIGYAYSGQLIKSQRLAHPLLIDILKKVNDRLNTKFNGILVNEYINGEKVVGAHSDDEAALDKINPCIASIAYGAVRKFRIRDKLSGKIVLDHGHEPCSLIVMQGDFQKEYKHEIPQEKRVKDTRISLTFRHHTK